MLVVRELDRSGYRILVVVGNKYQYNEKAVVTRGLIHVHIYNLPDYCSFHGL